MTYICPYENSYFQNSWYDNESKNQKMAVLEVIRVMGIETADRIREEGPKIILNKVIRIRQIVHHKLSTSVVAIPVADDQ